jgi:hypothetical protein
MSRESVTKFGFIVAIMSFKILMIAILVLATIIGGTKH